MMDKIKRFMSVKCVEQFICSAVAIAVYTLFVLLLRPSFAEWLNAVTDVFMGVVLGQIAISFYEIIKGDRKYRTWQYFLGAALSLVSLGAFFAASRAEFASTQLFAMLFSLAVLLMYALERKFLYEPSTLSFDEMQERTWAYMRTKAKKMGREKFLAWEKTFRAYPTCNGSTQSDLDFSRPYGTYEVDGTKVPLTFEKAKALGKNDIAVAINDDLVGELDTDGIN